MYRKIKRKNQIKSKIEAKKKRRERRGRAGETEI